MGKKGKATNGRAKARGKAKKNSPPQKHALDGRSSLRVYDDDDDNTGRGSRGFAQNSPRGNYSPRTGPSVKLRHQAITFVSAGSNTPVELDVDETTLEVGMDGEESGDDEDDDDEEDVEMDEDDEVDDSMIQTNIVMDAEVDMSAMKIASPVQAQEEEAPAFFVDTEGDNALAARARPNARQPPVRVRSPSPAPSDSSEEVVVFHGRGKGPSNSVNGRAKQTNGTSPAPSRQRSPHITDDLLAALRASGSPSPSPAAKGWAAAPARPEASASDAWKPAPLVPYWRKPKARPDLDPPQHEMAALEDTSTQTAKVKLTGTEEEELEKDAEATIAELQADWKQVLKEKRNGKAAARSRDEIDEPELVLGKKPNRRSKRGRKKSNRQLRGAIADDDEDEDDEEAAYDDYMRNLAAQLSGDDGEAPTVPSTFNPMAGPSLVIDGREIPESRVFKHDSSDEWEDESSSEEEGHIGQDYDDIVSRNSAEINSSDLDSSDLEQELEDEEREAWEDEEDLRQRRQDRMTDEQIARLLAKQEELGILGDDIVLEDGFFNNEAADDDDDADGIGDLAAARIGLRDLTNSSFATPIGSSKRQRKRSKRHGDFSFPSASLLADTVEQYGENGFDIMDFDRPSLRPTKKGRKGQLPAELDALSDEDLRDSLNAAWEKDRDKKRLKKAEREELRREGLLGSAGKRGKADLGEKYVEGMNMRQVHEELRVFLQSEHQSRPFPPMAKGERKVLHQVADKLNLKSKSVGSGKNRFPVLYKTRFTLEYEEEHLTRICLSASKGFLKNSSFKAKKPAKVREFGGRKARGGFDKSAVSLRNGEVVGADAKELGKENFGHRLMEKMGWQAGTALGKDGEGLLVPVAQVMRSGKAGLG